MDFPINVTFRNLAHSEALEAEIREEAAALGRSYDRIHACRVTIDLPHRHHQNGRRYNVRIELSVPGDDIVVSYEGAPVPDLDESDRAVRKDAESDSVLRYPHVAVRDAFARAQRRLQDYARRQRGDVKSRHVGE
jgi:hypothetical protein